MSCLWKEKNKKIIWALNGRSGYQIDKNYVYTGHFGYWSSKIIYNEFLSI